MNDWLAGKSCPECHCAELRQADPSWPTVVVDGIPHVAASQGTVPWPVSLQHLARWPASLALPPTWDDLASAVREAFRGLRKRCRILQDDPCTDSAIVECTAELWSLFSSGTGGDTPISHADIQAAKTWLRGMFVTVFDHNLSCLAVTCQRLAYEQACKLLDLSGPVSEPNIVWELANTKALQDAIVQMAVVPDLKDEFLMPNNFTKVPKHQMAGRNCGCSPQMEIAWTSLAIDYPETRHAVLSAALCCLQGSGCFVGSIPTSSLVGFHVNTGSC